MADDIPQMMRAARVYFTGGSDQVRVENAPTPNVEADHVLVRVEFAGINPIDWKIREGERPVPLPITLGHDLVGHVAAVGPQAGDAFTIGDRVYAMIGEGAFAQYAAVPAAALARSPAGLSPAEAAAIPMGALTAWKALFDIADLKSGERVLIHGAGGAVGGEAAQLAKHAGAWVAATASGDDLTRVREYGLDMVIDYTSEDFNQLLNGDKGVDLVLDVLGGETRDRSWESIRNGGRMVSTLGATEPPAEAAARGIKGLPGWGATPDGARLAEVTRLYDEGVLSIPEPQRFPLAETARAMDAAEHGHAGKVVIEMGA